MSLRTAWASNQVGPAMVSGVSVQVPAPASRSTGDGGGGVADVAAGAADGLVLAVAVVVRDGWPLQAARTAPRPISPPAARTLRRSRSATGYQPRSRHSARCGRSAPMVVSLPWPG